MPFIPFAFVVLAAVTGPAADPPTPPMCPHGDGPGELGALVHTSRLRALDVVDGHGVLTFEDVVENRSPGPASIELSLGRGGVVRAASIEEPGFAPRPARLDDVDAARAQFDGYLNALRVGVPPEEAVSAAERAAILVVDGTHGDRDEAPVVNVVMPCSIRWVTVRVEMLVPSIPIDGMWQFALPGDPGVGVSNAVLVDSAQPIRAFFAGAPLAAGETRDVPTVADRDGDGVADEDSDGLTAAGNDVGLDDGLDDSGMLALTVRPMSGPKLRTRGYALRIDPTAPPPPRAPARGEEDARVLSAPVTPIVIARAELDLPRPLSSAPAGLRIVFVVDNSVSVRDAGVTKALQILDGILDQAPPDARFAVVTAGRKARVVVAPWQARDDRALPSIALENGSDVLGALAKARAIASDLDSESESDGHGAREVARIIAISDMQLRFVDDDTHVANGFGGTGAPLTHVVTVADGDIEQSFQWARSFADDDPRAAGPESTGGVWIDAGAEDEATLFPHLIAPTRIDRPRVVLGGLDLFAETIVTDENGAEQLAHVQVIRSPRDEEEEGAHHRRDDMPQLPERLHAGSGLRVDVQVLEQHPAFARFAKARGARELRIDGQLWATPFDEVVRRDESLLGLAATSDLSRFLDDDLVRTIARRAQTVSRVTALVEVPPFRPASVDVGGYGMSGFGCSCCGGCCGDFGFGRGCGLGLGADLKERETLEALLRDDARACLVPRASLAVEFGDEEILSVTERDGGTCVAERFWQHRLDQTPRVGGAFHSHQAMTIGTVAP